MVLHAWVTRTARATVLDAAMFLWAVTTAVAGGYMLAIHTVQLPLPAQTEAVGKLQSSLEDIRSKVPRTPWFGVHVLLEACGCSRRIANHLMERGPLGSTGELVLLVEDPEEDVRDGLASQMEARGFSVLALSKERLAARFGIEAAPAFVVAAPDGSIAYLGGYTAQRRGPVIQDKLILDALQSGARPEPLPMFGCAVSQKLKDAVDPLGLK